MGADGVIIGTQSGTTGFMYASDDFGDEKVKGFTKTTDAVAALINGQVDCVMLDNEPAKALVAANADAHHHRRTGVGAGFLDCLDDGVFYLVQGRGRFEHLQRGHVLAASALGCHRDGHLVTGNQAQMEDSRGVVLRVHPPQGVADDGLAQKAIGVPGGYTGVDGVL